MEMLTRFQTGRLKVFSDLEEWFDEYRLYHRKDGKVFKEYDDLLLPRAAPSGPDMRKQRFLVMDDLTYFTV